MAMPHVHAGAVPDLLNTGLLLSNIYQNNVIHVCLLNIIEMLIAISMYILFSFIEKIESYNSDSRQSQYYKQQEWYREDLNIT